MNGRFLLVTLGVIGAVLVGLYFLHGFQVDRQADLLLEQARVARERGDLDAAVAAYVQYVRFRPQDADALGTLAELLRSTSSDRRTWMSAYLAYGDALGLNPSDNVLRRRAALLAFDLRLYDEVVRHVESLRKLDPEFDDEELVLAEARSQLGLGREDLAIALLLSALESDEVRVDPYRLLLASLDATDEVPTREALEQLAPENSTLHAELLQVFPAKPRADVEPVTDAVLRFAEEHVEDEGELLVLATEYHVRRGRLDEARRRIDRALEVASDSPAVRLAAVRLCFAEAESATDPGEYKESLDEAREHATAGAELKPINPRFHLALYEIALRSPAGAESNEEDRLALAERHLREGLDESLPAALESAEETKRFELQALEYELKWYLADLRISQGELDEGERLAEALSDAGAPIAMVRYLEGRVHFGRQSWLEASVAFEECRSALSEFPSMRRRIDTYLVAIAGQLKNDDRRLLVLRRAIDDDPTWSFGRLLLGRTMASMGRLAEARQNLALASGIEGARVELARMILLEEGRRRRRGVNDEEVWSREKQQILKLLDSTTDGDQDIVRAQIHALDRDWTRAEELLEGVCESDPTNANGWSTLARLKLAEQDDAKEAHAACTAILERAREHLPADQVDLRIVEIEAALRLPTDEAVDRLKTIEAAVIGADSEGTASVLEVLANAYSALQQPEEAMRLLERVVEKRDTDPALRLQLAQRLVEADRLDDAENVLEQVQKIEGANGPIGNYGLAMLELEQARRLEPDDAAIAGHAERAGRLLEMARDARPTWGVVYAALAAVEEMKGATPRSVEYLKQAVENGDERPSTLMGLLRGIERTQGMQAAIERLDILLERNPSLIADDDIARSASRIALSRDERNDALDIAKRIARRSNNARDLVWLAMVGMAAREPREEVESALRGAIDKLVEEKETKSAADAYRLYVAYLEREGEDEAAAALVAEATERLPGLEPLQLARLQDSARLADEAAEQYRRAVRERPDDHALQWELASFLARNGRSESAVEEFQKLQSRDDVPETIRRNAVYAQALLIGGGGRYSDMLKALSKLRSVEPKTDAERVAQLRVQAAILARRPTRREQRRLVGLLKQLEKLESLSPAESFQLATRELALAKKDSDEEQAALARLNRLAKASPDNVGIQLRLADFHLDRDQADEAERHVTRVNELEPDSFRAVALRARLASLRGNLDEAVRLCREFLAADRTDKALRSVSAALASSEIDEALELLQGLPEERRAEIRALATAGKPDEAFDVVRQFVNENALVKRFLAAQHQLVAGLLEELGAGDEAEKQMRTYVAKSEPGEATLALAAFLGRRDKFDEAYRLCERDWNAEPNVRTGILVTTLLRDDPAPGSRIEEWRLRFETERRKPDSPTTFIDLLAFVADLKGDYAGAEKLYLEAIAENPNDVIALNNLAWLYAVQGREVDQAQSLISRAILLAGEATELLDTRSYVNSARGRHDDAIADANAALDEPSAARWLHSAIVHWKAGQATEAIDALQQARESGLTESDIHPLERPAHAAILAAEAGSP